MRSSLLAAASLIIISACGTQAGAETSNLSSVQTSPRYAPHGSGHPRANGVPLGPAGVRATGMKEKPKSKQDIEDEKKLEHDLKICIGC